MAKNDNTTTGGARTRSKSTAKKTVTKRAVKKVAKKKAKKTKTTKDKVASLKLERMKLAELNLHPRNDEIRQHPEEGSPKWRVLAKSLKHDYFDPIVWNVRNGFLVSGHFRYKVMRSEGYTHADVVVVDYDEATHMARMIAANKGLGEENLNGVASWMKELGDIDLSITSFEKGEIKDLLGTLSVDTPTTNSSEGESNSDSGGHTSDENYEAPKDRIPLNLAYPPTEQLEVMRIVRIIRANIADSRGCKLSEVTTSEAVYDALLAYEKGNQ